MRDLTYKEREFLERVCEACLHKRDQGYWCFTFRKKHYKRSRILLQLHLNKKLELWEIVHHKDGNKENDDLGNLEVLNNEEHISYHHSGTRNRKNKPSTKSNKLKQEVINKIFQLSKITNNYSKIARELKISDNTIRRYLKNKTTP